MTANSKLKMNFISGIVFAFSAILNISAGNATESKAEVNATESSYEFDSSKGTVEFLAIGNPGALRVKGNGTGPYGKASISSNKLNATFEFNLTSLKTGIELRDTHMKEKYLQTAAHPTAVLIIKEFNLPQNALKDAENSTISIEVPAELTLHGVTKGIKCQTTIDLSAKTPKISSEFKIRLADFGIDIPSYLGITVAETVDVTVKASSNAP